MAKAKKEPKKFAWQMEAVAMRREQDEIVAMLRNGPGMTIWCRSPGKPSAATTPR
ncbi:hypothetical protein MesoLj131c_62250 [Mesorhizobium sp. 131-3-5]|nr:hypothetical protein MesoLj131c_62250 [Mesorhizobium sp. 131-3-5]